MNLASQHVQQPLHGLNNYCRRVHPVKRLAARRCWLLEGGDRRVQTFFGDLDRRSQRLGEHLNPELLDHPAQLHQRFRRFSAAGGPRGQFLVAIPVPLHRAGALLVAVDVFLRELVQPHFHRFQIAVEVPGVRQAS